MQAHRFGWLFGAAALISANAASAQDCADDADCGDGYVCKSYEYEACSDTRKPCPADDPACPEQQPMPAGCTTETYTTCEPKPCSDDSDCPDTMVCHSETYSECSGGGATPMTDPACPKDGDCPMIDPQPVPADTCTDKTVSACTPRWALPCTQDADCGGGFDCKEQLIGTCSGSSGGSTPPMAGGDVPGSADGGVPGDEPAPTPPDEMCSTEPSGEFYCELRELPCASDDDCPSGLSCQDSYADSVCVSPGAPAKGGSGSGEAPAGTAGAGAAPDAGADMPVDDGCANVEPKKMCMPPNYYGRGGVGIADSASGTAGGGTSSGEKGDSQDGAEPPTESPEPNTGAHAATGSDDEGSGRSDGESTNDSKMNTNSGCAVSAAGSNEAGVLGFLSMLGLSVLVLRRRKA